MHPLKVKHEQLLLGELMLTLCLLLVVGQSPLLFLALSKLKPVPLLDLEVAMLILELSMPVGEQSTMAPS